MMSLTHKAAEKFANDLFATQATGAKLVVVGEYYAKCTLDLQPKHRNAMGGVMGGVMFTLADLAFAAAANSRNIEAGEPLSWVSTNSSIHYLSQPKGNTLTAETQSIKTGWNSCLFSINIYDEQHALVSIVMTEGRRASIQ